MAKFVGRNRVQRAVSNPLRNISSDSSHSLTTESLVIDGIYHFPTFIEEDERANNIRNRARRGWTSPDGPKAV